MIRFRFFLYSLAFVLLFSCTKQADFTETDAACIFVIKDLTGVDISEFRPKVNDNGKPYFFTKDLSKLNGTMLFYGEWGYEHVGSDKKLSLTASFNLQSTTERAKQLYDGQAKPSFGGNSRITQLDRSVYGIDDGVLISSGENTTIAVIKGRLVYWVLIEGFPDIKEENIKPNFIVKLAKVIQDFGY